MSSVTDETSIHRIAAGRLFHIGGSQMAILLSPKECIVSVKEKADTLTNRTMRTNSVDGCRLTVVMQPGALGLSHAGT